MLIFEQALNDWVQKNIYEEKNQKRREILEKGLGHRTVEFLRHIWFPTVGNFNHLYPEWEVRDFNNGYRYLDLLPTCLVALKGVLKFKGTGPMIETST